MPSYPITCNYVGDLDHYYMARYMQAWVGGASIELKRAQRPKVQR